MKTINVKKLIKENKGFLLIIILMAVFRSSIADWNTVPTGSMNPTIIEGDRILINKLAYDVRLPFIGSSIKKLDDPKVGEIIVFNSKVADLRLVKRVIGVPGDKVAMLDNELFVNGEKLEYEISGFSEEYIHLTEFLNGKEYQTQRNLLNSNQASFSQVTVPDNHFLVLGDNRDNSVDSRSIGFVPRDEIIGNSEKIVMSLNYDNYYIPRSDRFFIDL